MTAAVSVAKLPVLPVSATVAGIFDGATKGGPSGVSLLVQDGSVVTMVFNLVVLLLGSPRPQVLDLVASLPPLRLPVERYTAGSSRLRVMVLLPPNMCSMVGPLLCSHSCDWCGWDWCSYHESNNNCDQS